MSSVQVKQFLVERRTLLKWTAAALVAGKAIDFDEVFAAGECKTVPANEAVGQITDSILNASQKSPVGNEFLYWIDGQLNSALPNYSSADAQSYKARAKISCTMNILHNNLSYIESVTLAEVNASGLTMLAQTFYGPGSGLTYTGKAPYTVFENISIDTSKSYQIIYVKNNGSGKPVTVFQHTINNPRQSRFDFNHLIKPKASPGDMSGVDGGDGYLTNDQMNNIYLPWLIRELRETNQYCLNSDSLPRTGFVTTPFSATYNDGDHTVRARIRNIFPAGDKDKSGDFEIEIEFMHGDTDSDAHYMRYFLVLDPVGRVLGGVRRNIKDGVSGKVLVKRGFHTPYAAATGGNSPATGATVRYLDGAVKYYDLYGTSSSLGDVPIFDADLRTRFIESINILDCPYIQILTDDRFHAIARCIMRLR